MNLILHLTGELPENCAEALTILAPELGMTFDPSGVPVSCARGDALTVRCDGERAFITYAEPVQLYRALSLLPVPLAPCDIREAPCFASAGAMLDCSRNAVLTPASVRFFLRKQALMGLNLMMLYTEDTYEVPEQPFFGYKRGRYTFEELKALDDYAYTLGIELCPCVQALGHLKRVLHWPALNHLRDNDEVLLADEPETYVLLEQMLRAASAPFRSRRIHLGMDEAFGVGLGAHLVRHGYENPHAVIGRHLRRVLEITDKLGLHAMMWSDMYFHLDGHHYHSPEMPSQSAIDAVDPRAALVYWDYYHAHEEEYAGALARHARFPAETVFAGGLWTWCGPAPSYSDAIGNTVPALAACKKAGVKLILATAWGDDGAECNLAAALPALQLYGEYMYTGRYDPAALAARVRRCCHADAQAFFDLSQLNLLPGLHGRPGNPINACKFLLYQDPLVQLFEADTASIPMAAHFAQLTPLYTRHAAENPEFALLFRFYAALSDTLAKKCAWHERAAGIVRGQDRAAAAALAQTVPEIIQSVEALRAVWSELWYAGNKPYGFEIIDARLGGVRARLLTAAARMDAFARGELTDIPELSSETLIYKRQPDNTIFCTNTMQEIVSACTIDF